MSPRPLQFAPVGQGRVHDDLVQPGAEFALQLGIGQSPVSGKHGVLIDIVRVVRGMGEPSRNR